jgi:hypothetical protein
VFALHKLTWPLGIKQLSGERFGQMLADERFIEQFQFVPSAFGMSRSLMADADLLMVIARIEWPTEAVQR